MIKRVLAVGAHPDDVELGCGGFIQHSSCSKIIVLSSGEKGSSVNRSIEVQNAANILTSRVAIHGLPDTNIQIYEAVQILEQHIKDFQPDCILTMSKTDTHQDHQTAYRATKIAARDTACILLSYASPSSAQDFRPTWFVPITTDQMQIKLKAINCHKSQQYRQYFSKEYILGMARYWAMVTRSKNEYIEPYELVRYLGK